MTKNSGSIFQKETKYFREKIIEEVSGMLDWSKKPKVYKEYFNFTKVSLPAPITSNNISLNDCLKKRRSVRCFSSKSISLEELSYLLWASTGIQKKIGGFEFRTAPSAGALYPIETYLFTNNVQNLDEGIYHYNIKSHFLEQLKIGNFKEEIAYVCLNQKMFLEAAVVFVWSAVFYRSKWKYEERAYRYIYLDVGHIAQNLALATTSLGLGSCQNGAFFDDEVNKIIGLDGENESVIYLSVVGNLP